MKPINSLVAALVTLTVLSCATPPQAPSAPPAATPTKPTVPLSMRPAVAVFSFEVKSTDPAYAALGSDAASALTEALIKGSALRPVEREKLEAILMEQEFSTSGLVRESDAIAAGKLAGAKYIMIGTVSVIAGQVKFTARLLDVETAEIKGSESIYGPLASLMELQDGLAAKFDASFQP